MSGHAFPVAERVITAPPWHPKTQSHAWHELLVPISGTYALRDAHGVRLTASAGTALFIPANTGHRPSPTGTQPIVFNMCLWHQADLPWFRLARVEDGHGRLLFLANWMVQLSGALDRSCPLPERLAKTMRHLVGLIVEELHTLLAQPLIQDAKDQAIHLVCDHLRANLHEQNRLDQLAAMIGIGEDALIARFRRATGTTPYRFIQQARLDKAMALLAGTNLSVAAIAAAVGYGSVSHFSNLMLRRTGRRPTAFRSPTARSGP